MKKVNFFFGPNESLVTFSLFPYPVLFPLFPSLSLSKAKERMVRFKATQPIDQIDFNIALLLLLLLPSISLSLSFLSFLGTTIDDNQAITTTATPTAEPTAEGSGEGDDPYLPIQVHIQEIGPLQRRRLKGVDRHSKVHGRHRRGEKTRNFGS